MQTLVAVDAQMSLPRLLADGHTTEKWSNLISIKHHHWRLIKNGGKTGGFRQRTPSFNFILI
jgi:hypothetical protein